tara:strand:- start:886 stop:1233 length:348 start_codon:yes stop_codon:yes gene_type:complete
MAKMLYFAKGAIDGTTSTEEVACFPIDKLSHFEMSNTGDLRIFFESSQELTKDIDQAVVALDITVGKHKEVMQAIAKAAYENKTGTMAVIADSEEGVYCTPHITACASISVVDAA